MSFKVIIGENIQKNLSIPEAEFVCGTNVCHPLSTHITLDCDPLLVQGTLKLEIFEEALSSSYGDTSFYR